MTLPSLESLRCFQEAARLQNFRAAARKVALTPAALGQRIKLLEELVGQPLFHRTTRKVVLTQAGLALVPHVDRTLAQAAQCVPAARGQLGPVALDLTIGTRHELGMSWVLPLLPRLRQAHPGLTPHLYFGSGADLLIRVRTTEIDCAVGSMVTTDPLLESHRLHREDYLFVGAASLLKRVPLKKDADAGRHTLLDTHAELPLFNYWRGAPGGGDRLTFRHILRMGTTDAIRTLVLKGEGVAVLPRYLVDEDVARGRLARVFPSTPLLFDHFRLFYRRDDPRRALLEALAQEMARVPLQ